MASTPPPPHTPGHPGLGHGRGDGWEVVERVGAGLYGGWNIEQLVSLGGGGDLPE